MNKFGRPATGISHTFMAGGMPRRGFFWGSKGSDKAKESEGAETIEVSDSTDVGNRSEQIVDQAEAAQDTAPEMNPSIEGISNHTDLIEPYTGYGSDLWKAKQLAAGNFDDLVIQNYTIHDPNDPSHVLGSLENLNVADLGMEPFKNWTFYDLYLYMDDFLMDWLTYLSVDCGWGWGVGILAISCGVRGVMLPFFLLSSRASLKMKLLEPEFAEYQATMKRLQQSGNKAATAVAQAKFNKMRKEQGINNKYAMVPLLQIPILFSWFWSLRYMSDRPDKFPGLDEQGFLWFTDLTAYDPYFIVPVISGCLSYYAIKFSQMNTSKSVNMFSKFAKYFKYFAFFSIPVVSMFPMNVVLYWVSMNAFQLGLSAFVASNRGKALMGIPKYLPGSILEKQHAPKVVEVIKPHIVSTKPSKAKIGNVEKFEAAAKSKSQVKVARHKPGKGKGKAKGKK